MARKLFLCLGLYFGLHVLTRSLLSDSLQLDEAEQLLLTQEWRWGYGSQGPLYTWLQKVFFAVFGTNVFALSLLKNSLLFGIYAFVFFAAREILGRDTPAVFAAASLLLIPNIAWESQRDQTHLILATACAAATLFAFVRLLKTGRAGWYALTGALIGLGALSKYNYLFFAAALIPAALSMPRFRPALLNGKTLLILAGAAVVLAPHALWIFENKDLAMSQSYKFRMAAPASLTSAWLAGVAGFARSVCAFLAVPLLVYSPLLFRSRRAAGGGGGDAVYLRFLPRLFAFALALSLAAVLIFRVTSIKDRWMEPLLFAAPIWLAGRVVAGLERGAGKWILGLSCAAGLAVLVGINGTALGANVINRAHNLNIPYRALAGELRKAGFRRGTIIASGMAPGGNLRMQFKDSPVIVEGIPFDPLAPTEPILIVWNPNRQDRPPRPFIDFVKTVTGMELQEASLQSVEVPCRNGPRKSERLGFVLLSTTEAPRHGGKGF